MKTPEQKLAYVITYLRGLQKSGYSGQIHLHMNQGGFGRVREEREVHLYLVDRPKEVVNLDV